MTIDELTTACRKAIDSGASTILLTLPKMPSESGGIKLAGKGSPRAVDIICVREGSHTVARFKAKRVLEWIRKNT